MKQNGFSLIELMVVVSLLAILSATAFTNYKRFRLSAYDASAESQVRNAFVAVEGEALASEATPNFFLSGRGPGALRPPLEHVILSSGIQLTVAKYDFSFAFRNTTYSYEYRYALGSHNFGCYQYLRLAYRLTINGSQRKIDINNKTRRRGASAECL